MNKKARTATPKRPLWMKLSIFGGVTFLVFFILFWVFLYSPFEGEYETELTHLIPPDIHFLLRKTEIRADFEDFPEPVFWDRLQESAKWQEMIRSPEWQNFEKLYQPDALISEIRTQVDAIPLISFDRDVLGKDAVISGYFHGQDLEQTTFLIATRVSAMMKIMYELLGYSSIRSLLSLPSQDLGAFMEIQPPQAPTPYYLHRDRDLVLLTNDRGLMERSLEIKREGPQESISETDFYSKRFTVRQIPENYADFYAVAPKLIETFQLLGDPRQRDEQKVRQFFFKLLNPESFEYIRGFLEFDNPTLFQGIIGVDERRMTSVQHQLANGERLVLNKEDRGVQEGASWFPQQTAVFSALTYPPAEFLQILFDNLHPDTQKLLREVMADSQGFKRPEDLFAAVGAHLGETLFVGLYPDEGEKPAFVQPEPDLLAVVDAQPGRAEQATRVLDDYLGVNREAFGTEEPVAYTLGDVKYYRVRFKDVAEEDLVVCYGPVGDRFVISTRPAIMDECIKLSRKGETQLPLARTDAFQNGIGKVAGEANFFLFLNMRPLMKLVRADARYWAYQNARLDERAVRQEEESRLRKLPPYNQYRQLPGELRTRLNEELDQRMEELRLEAQTEGFARRNAIAQATLTPWEMLRGATVVANVTDNDSVLQLVFDWMF